MRSVFQGFFVGSESADHAAHAEGEFVHVELADNHRTRLLQSAHHFGILCRNALAILIAGRRGEYTGGVEEIF